MSHNGKSSLPRSFLPPSLTQILERKSTRDPFFRFEKMLLLLLNFVSEQPDMGDVIIASITMKEN
jgi:hypothetical protein